MPPLLCTPNSVVRPRTPLVEPSQPPVTRLSSHLSQVSLRLPPHRITYLLLRLAILIACRAFSFLASHLHFICSFSFIAWFLRPCSYPGARLCSRGFFSVLALILPLGICTNTYVSRQSEPVARKNAPCLLQSEPWFPRLSNQHRTQESTKKLSTEKKPLLICGILRSVAAAVPMIGARLGELVVKNVPRSSIGADLFLLATTPGCTCWGMDGVLEWASTRVNASITNWLAYTFQVGVEGDVYSSESDLIRPKPIHLPRQCGKVRD